MSTSTSKRAIVVGIDRYDATPLDGCVNDAVQISEILAIDHFGFGVTTLYDADATRSGILSKLRPIIEQEGDTLLFFFAGHGTVIGSSGYLVTFDGNSYDPGLALAELASLLEQASTNYSKVITILDSCYSGIAPSWIVERPLSNAVVDTQLEAVNSARIVMAACRPDELASETHNEQSLDVNGVFSRAIIDGMLGDAVNFEGEVTMHGLFEFVSHAVSAEIQTPVFKGDSAGSVILGCGLTPRVGRPIGSAAEKEILSKARRLLDEYQILFIRESSQELRRKQTGYSLCSRNLAEVIRWFDATKQERPDIVRSSEWVELADELRRKQAGLSDIGVGDNLTYGLVTNKVGVGGFGTVWEVATGETPVAYKVFHGSDLSDKIKPFRFRNGFSSMKKLVHPNIVRVHELTEAPLGFTMDLILGADLRDAHLDRTDLDGMLALLHSISDTVAFAHRHGVIHRDIKPENVILGWSEDKEDHIAFLTDFDLAYVETNRTVTAHFVGGAPNYASPEQLWQSNSEIARAATVDIFGMAQLLYFILFGKDPVGGRTSANVTAFSTFVRSTFDRVPAEIISTLYEKCTMDSPAARFQSMDDFAAEILRARAALVSDSESPLSANHVGAELAYLYGLSSADVSVNASAVSFLSKSEMLEIEVVHCGVPDEGKSSFRITLTTRDSVGAMLGNRTGQEHRKLLNRRIDKKIKRHDRVERTAGSSGYFSTILNIDAIPLNKIGAKRLLDLMVDVLSAIEDA